MGKEALAAECLTAVTGLYPSKPIRVGDAEEAIALPKAAARAVSAFMSLESPEKPLRSEQIGYLSTWVRLNEKQDDREVVSTLEDPEVGAAYLNKLNDAREFLKSQWRPTKINNLTGPEILPPSRSEEDRCRDLYAMVGDPRRMLARLSSGCVLMEELAALQEVYPEFVNMVSIMLKSEIARRTLRRKSYRVPHWQEIAIRAFLGEPFSAEAETVNAETTPPEAPKEPPEIDIKLERRRVQGMTNTDRVQDGSASGQ